jgi:DNA-binding PadR family transcriptional regulator
MLTLTPGSSVLRSTSTQKPQELPKPPPKVPAAAEQVRKAGYSASSSFESKPLAHTLLGTPSLGHPEAVAVAPGASLKGNLLSLQSGGKAALAQLGEVAPGAREKIAGTAGSATAQAAATNNIAGSAETPEAAASALHEAQEAYDDAHEEVTELDQKLATQLAELGPALTEDQKQAYIEAYYTEHRAAYEANEQAAAELAQALTDPRLEQAVVQNPELAYAAADAAADLAESHGKEVLEWAGRAFDPANPASEAYSKIGQALTTTGPEGLPLVVHDPIDLGESIIGPALGSAAGQIAATSSDVGPAIEEFESLVNGLKGIAKGAFEAKGGVQLLNAIGGLKDGRIDAVAAALTNVKSGAVSIGLGAAGVVFAGLAAKNAAQQGDYDELVEQLARAGRGGTEILASALHSFTGAAKAVGGLQVAPASFLDRLAPGLGVVANAIQFAQHGEDFLEDPSVGHGLQALGDLVALVGSGVAVAVPGVGQIIEGVGLVISGIGTLITGNEEKRERDEEQEELLVEAGVDPDVARTLAEGDEQPELLSEQLEMSPEEIQELAKEHPELFEAPGYTQALIDAARAVGLEGDEVNGFIDALENDDPRYLDTFFAVFSSKDPFSPSVHEETLRQIIDGSFPSASEYVREASPEVYGDDAEQAQQADRDYELEQGSTNPYAAIGNLLKDNDDPAYQARIIERLEEDGLLDIYAEEFAVGHHYNGWNEVFLEALQSAEEQGVISEEELEQYSEGLE